MLNIFEGCSGLESIYVNNRNTRYDSRDNCKAIIETSSNTLIVGCKNTIVPNTVTGIGNSAFYNCSGLTSITIPESVTSIGSSAFNGCSNLSNVISEIMNPFAFGSSAFNNISSICTLTVPATTTEKYIEVGWTNSVFKGGIIDMSEPETIIVSEGTCFTAKTIEGVDIRYMITDTSLHTIQVGWASPKEYWENSKIAINNNTTGSVTIPEKVVYGGIDYSVTYIANAAFHECSQLTSITIPESVTHIGHAAFEDCSGLTSIYIPNSVTSFDDGYAFYGCTNLATVHIPENIKVLPNDTFSKCSSLTSVTIPEGVTNVGKAVFGDSGDAFWKCESLTTIIIPSSVTYFVGNSFSDCNNLTTVMIRKTEPISINKNTFPNRKYATLYVPEGSKTAYENANYWKEFKEIVETPAPYNSHLTMIGPSICKGGKIKLPISMENEEEITAFQLDVDFPDGITVADVQLGDRKSDSHSVDFSKQEDGSYRVIAVSLQQTPFNGNDGEIVNLLLSADKNIKEGNYNIGIKNIVLTTSSKEKIYPEDVNSVLSVLNIEQGDADGDGFVDVADVVAMIDYILDSSTTDIMFLAADMNIDGEIDIFDVMMDINLILNRDNSAGGRTRASSNMEEQAVVTTIADGIMLGVHDASRFIAFQFDVEVADGMELTEASLNGNAGSHNLYFLKNDQNTYRVMGVSMDNSTLTDCGNDLVKLSFSKGGHVQISNIVFVTPQKSKVFFASGNGEVTGIGSIRYEQAEEIFDLSGRKVDADHNRLPKGVYIINNKKVVIK